LKVCVVGRSYPPEFYSWINKTSVRSLFEKIAIETEEDFQNIIRKLESFNVKVLRTELPETTFVDGKFLPPPMTPRDHTAMIGKTFYNNVGFNQVLFKEFYRDVRDTTWPECNSLLEFQTLPEYIKDECIHQHRLNEVVGFQKNEFYSCYENIFKEVAGQDNKIKNLVDYRINGAMVSRIGKDLFFGTTDYHQSNDNFLNLVNEEFPQTRNHIVNRGGQSDGTYCPVCPGLIISLFDVPSYAETYPGWEVVYLPGQSWTMVNDFLELKKKNKGRWWIPGFEYDTDVVDLVETWLTHWTGYVEETVFDVNMLIIDPKNVIVFNYNKQVFDALERHGITPHIVPFRHRYFWDGGIHCVTTDLGRTGTMQDFFS
jgi:hypothetical protein